MKDDHKSPSTAVIFTHIFRKLPEPLCSERKKLPEKRNMTCLEVIEVIILVKKDRFFKRLWEVTMGKKDFLWEGNYQPIKKSRLCWGDSLGVVYK